MVTFSSFLPLLNLSCTCFLAFLQILYVHSVLHFSLSVPVLVLLFFCTVLQLFALVFCLATRF